jgi:hypothetical protein
MTGSSRISTEDLFKDEAIQLAESLFAHLSFSCLNYVTSYPFSPCFPRFVCGLQLEVVVIFLVGICPELERGYMSKRFMCCIKEASKKLFLVTTNQSPLFSMSDYTAVGHTRHLGAHSCAGLDNLLGYNRDSCCIVDWMTSESEVLLKSRVIIRRHEVCNSFEHGLVESPRDNAWLRRVVSIF